MLRDRNTQPVLQTFTRLSQGPKLANEIRFPTEHCTEVWIKIRNYPSRCEVSSAKSIVCIYPKLVLPLVARQPGTFGVFAEDIALETQATTNERAEFGRAASLGL